ncbi:hypothetical protein [Aquipuribacter sp. SD81]|uniref:hypothetical protein n=1 Tax=Aquipuribacter sp. SD81 TaxID=3127703 RepID=UPI003015DC76
MSGTEVAGRVRAGDPPAVRADAWAADAAALAAAGRRTEALVAARTALALHERLDDAGAATADRRLVDALSGPDVVPLHVDLPAGDGADPREAAAVWVGAPAEPVLAMLGWRERDGALEVVRLVVPGTRRGRAALAPLLGALPREVPVTVRVPLRDPAVGRAVRRAGFVATGERSGGGYVGGSEVWRRGA